MAYFTRLGPGNPYSELAQDIIAQELHGRQPVEKPIALFTIGPAGAGKTTLLRNIARASEGDIERMPFVLNEKVAQKTFRDEQYDLAVGPGDEFHNAVWINTTKYREAIAEAVLKQHNRFRGADYGRANSPPEEKTALGYVIEHYPRMKDQIMQTGGEIARQLLIQCVDTGIPCVLDSTGGGFAGPPNEVTIPLMEAAKNSNASLYFLEMGTPYEIALRRVEGDLSTGKKPFVDSEHIAADIAKAPTAVELLRQHAGNSVDLKIIGLNPDLSVDEERSILPKTQQTGRAPSGETRAK